MALSTSPRAKQRLAPRRPASARPHYEMPGAAERRVIGLYGLRRPPPPPPSLPYSPRSAGQNDPHLQRRPDVDLLCGAALTFCPPREQYHMVRELEERLSLARHHLNRGYRPPSSPRRRPPQPPPGGSPRQQPSSSRMLKGPAFISRNRLELLQHSVRKHYQPPKSTAPTLPRNLNGFERVVVPTSESPRRNRYVAFSPSIR